MNEENAMGGHVSTFDLDVYWASGCPEGDALRAHIEDCARCSAYLASLEALESASPELVRAPSAVALQPGRPARRAWTRWAFPVATVMAVAASVLLILRPPGQGDGGYVATKGTPAVEILIHRGQDTRIWDGRSSIRAGDTLALRVACEGLDTVAVAAPADTGWTRLSDVACPTGGDPLPFTLRVDDQAGDEKLAVVLSHGALDAAALERAIRETRRAGDVWVVPFVLPKAGPPR